jgi:hypothetical protein
MLSIIWIRSFQGVKRLKILSDLSKKVSEEFAGKRGKGNVED